MMELTDTRAETRQAASFVRGHRHRANRHQAAIGIEHSTHADRAKLSSTSAPQTEVCATPSFASSAPAAAS
jgi:hypothetical protein